MTLSLLFVLWTGFGGAGAGTGGDCAQCSETAICAVHLEAQATSIKELKPKLKEKAAPDRIATLKKLAAASAEHPGVPSQEIAELVADALADPSYAVRTEAAQLLAADLHPEVAVRSLLAALEQVRKDVSKMGGGGGRGGFGGDDDEEAKDPKAQAAAQEARKLRDEMNLFTRTLVVGLGKLPDDRSVEALAEFLVQISRRSSAELLTSTGESLLALDARKGIEAVVAKIKASPPGSGGGRWGPDTTGKTLHELLIANARAKGLEGMPGWSEQEPPDWDKWFARNQKNYTAKLGKYDLAKFRKARA